MGRRTALAALLTLLAGACAATPDAPPAGEAGTRSAKALPVDPAVRIGRLPNDLTYYLRSNDAPGDNLELRLVVSAGSLEQEVVGSGVAHFLEHMLFNGTVDYPGNELDGALQALGIQLGADVNAFTTCEATVYGLSIVLGDGGGAAADVDTGFHVLDQWATAATIEPADVDDERGVVLEEFRTTETAEGVIAARFDEVYTAGSMYEGCDPIGTEEGIMGLSPGDLRRFYDRWYRPDLMAVVAVGDLPLDRMEEQVVENFSDNAARSGSPTRRPRRAEPVAATVAEVVVHPDAPSPFVSIDIGLGRRVPGTAEGERLLLLDSLLASLLQSHLDEGVASGDLEIVRPLSVAFAHAGELRFIGFNFVADDEAAGAAAVLTELRALAAHGFEEEAVQRELAVFRHSLDQAMASEASRQDHEFADSYVQHFLAGDDIDEVGAIHARRSEVLAATTADDATAHLAGILDRAGPLVLVVGHDPAQLPTRAELAVAVDWAMTAAPEAPAVAATRVAATLMDAPTGVPPVEVNRIPSHDAAELVYANGARVIAAGSDISEGQVDLWAESQGGWSLLAPGDSALVDLATGAVGRSGAGDMTAVGLEGYLQTAGVWLVPYIGETTEGFMGSARSGELEDLFALLHLRVTAPRVDGPAFAEATQAIRSQQRAAEADPLVVASIQMADARYGGDDYVRALPHDDQVEAFTPGSALAMYERRLGHVDDLVVAVVGDTDLATIRDLSDRYVGTLPGGPADTWADVAPTPPLGVVTRTVPAGPNDASAGFELLLLTPVERTEGLVAAARVLERLVETRLFSALREELGLSYGGAFVAIDLVDDPAPLAEVYVAVDGDPDGMEELHTRTLAELAELAGGGLDQASFERARAMVLDDMELVTNGDILERLVAWGRSGGTDSATLGHRYRAVAGLSARDVSTAAALLLPDDRRIEVFRLPGGRMP